VARRQQRAHHRAVRKQRAEERKAELEALATEEAAAEEEAASECDSNYSGCLSPTAYDYDCEGGSGDGPEYTGTVTVTGVDHYGLDSDSDGVGCEPY
jgi:hypothetical protein